VLDPNTFLYTGAQGAELVLAECTPKALEPDVTKIWTDHRSPKHADSNQRAAERRTVALPARLTWKDQRGTTRFASAVVRNISDFGVYVETQSPVSIPLYRLVQFQLEREGREMEAACGSFQGRILSAVYRVTPPAGSRPQGLALRLMVDPRRRVETVEPARATA
jgi:hypothetical protein